MDTILDQTLRDIEVICVDDDSSDRTLRLLYAYEAQDNRVHVLTQPHSFAGVARNTGMDIARGEYIAFLDSDDFFEPVMLERMVAKAAIKEADIVITGSGELDMETGRLSYSHRVRRRTLEAADPFCAMDVPDRIFEMTNPAPWNKLYRLDFVREQGLRFQSIAQSNDAYFTWAAMAAAKRITTVDQWLVTYRRRTSTSITETSIDRTACLHELATGFKTRLQENGCFVLHEESFIRVISASAVFLLDIAKTREQWINTAQYLKNVFVPEFALWGSKRTAYDNGHVRDTLAALMGMNNDALQRHDPSLRTDESSNEVQEAPVVTRASAPGPLVSVIVPVFDSAPFVEECVRSVMRQSLQNIEIICVDDGSIDGSDEILRDLAKDDSRIRVLSQRNQGLAAARNNGLAEATGEYVLFLDSDDLLNGLTLEHCYAQAVTNQLDDLFFGGCTFYDPVDLYHDQTAFYRMYAYKGSYPTPESGLALLGHLVTANDFNVSACMRLIRREFLYKHDLRFPVGVLHEDNLFTLQSLQAAQRAWVWNEPLYQRRVRSGSIMTQRKTWPQVIGYVMALLEAENMAAKVEGFAPEISAPLNRLRRRYEDSVAQQFSALSDTSIGQLAELPVLSPIYWESICLLAQRLVKSRTRNSRLRADLAVARRSPLRRIARAARRTMRVFSHKRTR